uniref:Phosphoesterase family protein n=1 Tax=Phaselicystis flava TaxID=525924 RepID=A0A3S5GYH7_9BACT|nr:phosphoesterase family protein [Phaselicystis flava]
MSKRPDDALPDDLHIVVAMFENRSFDNVLGWAFASSRPSHFIPPSPLARYNGLQGLDLAAYANTAVVGGRSYKFPPTRGYSTTTIKGVEYLMPPPVDPHEEFDHITFQIYGQQGPGRPRVHDGSGNVHAEVKPNMSGFAADYQDALGSGATVAQIAKVMETGTYAQTYPFGLLAHAYAVSDAWFSSTPTQTNPNRAFMACGTSQGKVNNGSLGFDNFTAPTIWNRLSEHNKSWKIYWENTFLPEKGTQPWTRQCFSQLKGFGDEYFPRMSQFHRDARLGRLPFFSFIEPSWTLEQDQEGFQGNDMHPPGDIRPGLQFLSSLYTSLVSNRDAWARTILLITFDEHGGTWDHVGPPTTATPDTRHTTGFQFDRFGPRVPTLLVSPMVEPGTVFRSLKGLTTPYDHTSIPATILTLAGIDRSCWKLFDRVDVAPTFEGVLTRARNPRTDVELGPVGGSWEHETDAPSPGLVNFGDPFILKYVGAGEYKNMYVTAGSTASGQYLWMTPQRSQAMKFRFTMGFSPDSTRPSGMFVRTPGNVHIQYAATWGPDASNQAYIRVPDSKLEVAQWCVFGQDDQWWYSAWYVSNLNRATLGAALTWGTEISIEYHELNGNTVWLPRKIYPLESLNSGYLAVGGDAEYNDPSIGRWVIESP